MAAVNDKCSAQAAIQVIDDALEPALQAKLFAALRDGNWQHGWRSNSKTDQFAFWHRHFGGSIQSDHHASIGAKTDCTDILKAHSPLVHEAWVALQAGALTGHTLIRCYANAFPFGCDGTLHTDTIAPNGFTAVYYPHDQWHPNWGGETVFFDSENADIVASIYPKPNRLLLFPGRMPHVARGVSRSCSKMRITLMFKTDLRLPLC